jgi:hypothetical protein
MAWNEMECPGCKNMITGEDMEDHPSFLTFFCEECGCGWSKTVDLPDIYDKGER